MCIGRAKARKPSWRISATCCWTIDRGSPSLRDPGDGDRRTDGCCCWKGSTVGADKGYDVARFVADVRVQDVTPHVAQKVRGSAIDGRTTRHAGYHVSQRKRKLVEQVFGWMKTVGGLRKVRHRGIPWWIGSSPSPPPPITWSGCGIWRRGVPDRRPRVSLAPSSGQRVPVRTVVGGGA